MVYLAVIVNHCVRAAIQCSLRVSLQEISSTEFLIQPVSHISHCFKLEDDPLKEAKVGDMLNALVKLIKILYFCLVLQ